MADKKAHTKEKTPSTYNLTATEISDVTSDVLSETVGEPLQSQKDIDFMKFIVVGVTVTLFIGFAAAFIAVGGVVSDWLAQGHAREQSARDEVKALKDTVEALKKESEQANDQMLKEIQDVKKTVQTPN